MKKKIKPEGIKENDELIVTSQLHLDGKVDLKKIKRGKERNPQAVKALKFLRQNGLSVPNTKQVVKSQPAQGQGPMNDDDVKALNDYFKGLGSLYNTLNNSSDPTQSNGERSANIRETQLDSKLGDLASMYATLAKQYYTAVANSKSYFYPTAAKQQAKDLVTEVEAILGDLQTGSRARAMRMQFVPALIMMSHAPFPDIAPNVIYDYAELQKIQREFNLLKFFRPWNADNPNSKLIDEQDKRGACDVNATFDLPFLYITSYFKECLSVRGVSSEALACLGNYTQEHTTTVDEDHEFDATSFTDIGELHAPSAKYLKHWAGYNACSPIQKDLLEFIDKWRVKSTSIISTDVNGTGLEAMNSNKFNADLALKVWLHLALNAVFKVMAEDGTGVMKRVAESSMRSASNFTGAKLYDISCELIDANTNYMSRPVKDAKRFLENRSFRYHPMVYKYLKDNWAPIIKKYEIAEPRYIGDSKMPNETVIASLLPRLILPCNPYDSQVTEYESKMNIAGFPSEVEGRGFLFRSVTLPSAYLDHRNRTDYRDITLRLDNLLSYALYASKRNRRFNAHSWKARLNAAGGEVNYADLSANLYTGPHILDRDDGLATNRRRSFFGDLWCSDIDRTVKLGLNYGYMFQMCDQRTGKYVSEGNPLDDPVINGPFLWSLFHTNPWSVRFMSICDWMSSNPTFINRWAAVNQTMSRFISGVLDGKSDDMGTISIRADEALLYATGEVSKLISIKDAFRHSLVDDSTTDKRFLFDNESGKRSVTIVNATGDESTEANQRAISYFVTRINKGGRFTRDSIAKSLVKFDGDYDFFGGKCSEESQWAADSLVVSSLRSNTIFSLLSTDPLFMHNNKYRLSAGGILVKPSKYGNTSNAAFNGYVRYNNVGCPSCFTKQVCLSSAQTYYGTTPTALSPASLTDTWYVTSEDIAGWANAIISWNHANPDLVHFGASEIEFSSIVTFILHGFPQVNNQPGSLLQDVRYSASVYASIGTYTGNDDIIRDVNHYVLQPNTQACTGIGHVFGKNAWADPKVTKRMMTLLGQSCMDAVTHDMDPYFDKQEHGIVVRVNESVMYLDLRKMAYTTPLPELVDVRTFDFI